MAKYIIASTRLNDDGSVHSVSHPIEVDSDTINTIKILDKTYILEKHGRWVKNEGRSGWHCSCCKKDDLYAYPYTENNERELQDFYCPNCGADMRGGENDNK